MSKQQWSDSVSSVSCSSGDGSLEVSRTPSPDVMNTENGVPKDVDIQNRKRKFSSNSSNSDSSKKSLTIETDPVVLARRQKDIDYGKNTAGYDNYSKAYPNRTDRADYHPRTPPMYKKMSRRNWDATVRKWRKDLHLWDPEEKTKNGHENGSHELKVDVKEMKSEDQENKSPAEPAEKEGIVKENEINPTKLINKEIDYVESVIKETVSVEYIKKEIDLAGVSSVKYVKKEEEHVEFIKKEEPAEMDIADC